MSTELKVNNELTQSLRDVLEKRTSIIYCKKEIIREYDIYLTHEFSDPRLNLDICNLLRTCEDTDKINFYLNNYGGDCSTGTQLLNALNQTKAREITVHVDASIYSMASEFAVAAVKTCGAGIVLGADVYFMFHNYSGGTRGKGHEMESMVLADKELFKQAHFNRLYPFLSSEEIKRIQDGGDLYFMRDELEKRYLNLINYVNKKEYTDGDRVIQPKKEKKIKVVKPSDNV